MRGIFLFLHQNLFKGGFVIEPWNGNIAVREIIVMIMREYWKLDVHL